MLSPEDVDPEIIANALEAMETTAPINYQAMELEDIARIILASASERLGRDLERMRGQRREARGLAKELSQQLKDAEQALALLHEGEEPHLDEAVVATPAQWIWRWNRTTPERRLEMAAALRLGLDERDRYERALRTIAERCPGHYGSVECTSAIAQAALTGPDERPNDDDLTGLLPGLNHIRTPDGAKDYSYWCPGGFGTCSGWLTAGHRTAAAATADYEQHVHRAHR